MRDSGAARARSAACGCTPTSPRRQDEEEFCLADVRPDVGRSMPKISTGSARTCGWRTACTSRTRRSPASRATGTGVAHCPTSNGRLGAGIAPTRALLDAGAPVGLGVDGAASNESGRMVGELHQALLAARYARWAARAERPRVAGHGDDRRGAVHRAGRTSWAASRQASSLTLQCGGSTDFPARASPIRCARWCSARRNSSTFSSAVAKSWPTVYCRRADAAQLAAQAAAASATIAGAPLMDFIYAPHVGRGARGQGRATRCGADQPAAPTSWSTSTSTGDALRHCWISTASRELVDWQRRDGARADRRQLCRSPASSTRSVRLVPGLAIASRTVGSPQIRNRGTLAGNLAHRVARRRRSTAARDPRTRTVQVASIRGERHRGRCATSSWVPSAACSSPTS